MKKTSSGFTLVELIIVIVVIAILASITIVSYNGVTQRANIARAQTTLKQAQQYIELHQIEHNEYPDNLSGSSISSDVMYFKVDPGYCASMQANDETYVISPGSAPAIGMCQTGNNVNYVLGATATPANPTGNGGNPISLVTDGSRNTGYYGASTSPYVTVDLGSTQTLSKVIVWHYPGRIYNDTKTQISADGTTWKTVFDSAVSGTYTETSTGNVILFSAQPVRYIRDYISGSNSNSSNHWIDIQAY